MLVFLIFLSLFSHAYSSLLVDTCSTNTNCGACTTSSGLILNLGILNLGNLVNVPCCWSQTTNKCTATGVLVGNARLCTTSGQTGVQYNCPVNPPGDFAYTDDYGRHKVLPFIAASFADTPEQAQTCLNHRANGALVQAHYVLPNCVGGTCSATISIWGSEEAIVIAFPGSDGAVQLLTTGVGILTTKVPFVGGGQVYQVYNDAFNGLWNMGLSAKLAELATSHPTYQLRIFGHSLGGGIASVASGHISYNRVNGFSKDNITFTSTGQTRVGDLGYAQAHDTYVPRSYRIINAFDLITKLPPKPAVSLLNQPVVSTLDEPSTFHHRFEAWYYNADLDMAEGSPFKTCKQAEDATCSGGTVEVGDLNFHNNYFNVPLDTWYTTGCL